MTPHKCPCCDGWGQREVWQPYWGTSTVPMTKPCTACGGSGVVWSEPPNQTPHAHFPVRTEDHISEVSYAVSSDWVWDPSVNGYRLPDGTVITTHYGGSI